ncbi:unnamed protein product, partial [marine sediment metagenome]
MTRQNEDRMAGLRIGKVTFRNVSRLEAPLTLEDSSREASKEDMAGEIIKYAMGRSSNPSTKIIPGNVYMLNKD